MSSPCYDEYCLESLPSELIARISDDYLLASNVVCLFSTSRKLFARLTSDAGPTSLRFGRSLGHATFGRCSAPYSILQRLKHINRLSCHFWWKNLSSINPFLVWSVLPKSLTSLCLGTTCNFWDSLYTQRNARYPLEAAFPDLESLTVQQEGAWKWALSDANLPLLPSRLTELEISSTQVTDQIFGLLPPNIIKLTLDCRCFIESLENIPDSVSTLDMVLVPSRPFDFPYDIPLSFRVKKKLEHLKLRAYLPYYLGNIDSLPSSLKSLQLDIDLQFQSERRFPSELTLLTHLVTLRKCKWYEIPNCVPIQSLTCINPISIPMPASITNLQYSGSDSISYLVGISEKLVSLDYTAAPFPANLIPLLPRSLQFLKLHSIHDLHPHHVDLLPHGLSHFIICQTNSVEELKLEVVWKLFSRIKYCEFYRCVISIDDLSMQSLSLIMEENRIQWYHPNNEQWRKEIWNALDKNRTAGDPLWHFAATPNFFPVLKSFVNFVFIDNAPQWRDEDLENLPNQLTSLTVDSNYFFTDKAFQNLPSSLTYAAFPSSQRFTVRCLQLVPKSLTELVVGGFHITNQVALFLPPKLSTVTFQSFIDAVVHEFAFQDIKLVLRWDPTGWMDYLDDQLSLYIASSSYITNLDLPGRYFTDDFLCLLPSNLERLCLSLNNQISPTGLLALPSNPCFTKLQMLEFPQNYNLFGKKIKSRLPKGLKSLVLPPRAASTCHL